MIFGIALLRGVDLSTSGIVFNIQRFSIHDGPGIRTTVFLKGCPLHCFWCHNPEGVRPNPEMQFFPERCIGCGACIEVCAYGGQLLQGDVRIYARENCQMCGRCVDDCFADALELAGKTMTVDEVMADVLSDRAFYDNSGGGVTLSGGEPLLQHAFSRQILERSKAEGLHAALETSAHCRWKRLQALLPLVDLVMMDLKQMDSDVHRSTTGVPNEVILANAERLMHTPKPVWFRTPVVPSVNDTPEAIGEIAAFVRRLTDIRMHSSRAEGAEPAPPSLELLPFHRLAGDKYRRLGLEDRVGHLEPPSPEKMDDLRHLARSYGIEVKD
jgi:pyruvate formate lyase activating enzyme